MKKVFTWVLLTYIKYLAKIALFIHRPQIIGIAGSVGKTSTRNLLYAGLKDLLRIKLIEGNSETGIPLGILGLAPEEYSFKSWLIIAFRAPFGLNFIKNTDYLIIEMGIDDPFPPKNMSYLLSIVKPNIAISLNATAAHTEQFEKILPHTGLTEKERYQILLEAIAHEDTQIITKSDCTVAIYNQDDLFVDQFVSEFRNSLKPNSKVRLVPFGQTESSTIRMINYAVSPQGTLFEFIIQNQTLRITIPNQVLPEVYKDNLAATLLTAQSMQLDLSKVILSIEHNLELPKGRSSIFAGIHHSTLIDSTYNASKPSMFAFLELLKKLQQNSQPLVVVFGDMRELGNESAMEHQEVAEKIAQIADYVYLVGPQTKEFVLPILQKRNIPTHCFITSQKAGEFIKENLPGNSLVLLKGSQNNIYLEEITKSLLVYLKDQDKICRQSDYWQNRKKAFFSKNS